MGHVIGIVVLIIVLLAAIVAFAEDHPETAIWMVTGGVGLLVLCVLCIMTICAMEDRNKALDRRLQERLAQRGMVAPASPLVAPSPENGHSIPVEPPSQRADPTLAWIQQPAPVITPVLAPPIRTPQWTLGHVLLYGPPGTGKTTLATVMAKELEPVYRQAVNVISITPAQLSTKAMLDSVMDQIQERNVVFIDEIHGVSETPLIEEALYSVLAEGTYHRSFGGMALSIQVPHCTMIGATTIAGQLSRPLRERFLMEWNSIRWRQRLWPRFSIRTRSRSRSPPIMDSTG
jgi:hypothetical protein